MNAQVLDVHHLKLHRLKQKIKFTFSFFLKIKICDHPLTANRQQSRHQYLEQNII